MLYFPRVQGTEHWNDQNLAKAKGTGDKKPWPWLLLTTLVACSWKSRDTKRRLMERICEKKTIQSSVGTANIVVFWVRHLGQKLFMYLPALLYLQIMSKHSKKILGCLRGRGGRWFQETAHKHAICQKIYTSIKSCMTNSSSCLLRCVLMHTEAAFLMSIPTTFQVESPKYQLCVIYEEQPPASYQKQKGWSQSNHLSSSSFQIVLHLQHLIASSIKHKGYDMEFGPTFLRKTITEQLSNTFFIACPHIFLLLVTSKLCTLWKWVSETWACLELKDYGKHDCQH